MQHSADGPATNEIVLARKIRLLTCVRLQTLAPKCCSASCQILLHSESHARKLCRHMARWDGGREEVHVRCRRRPILVLPTWRLSGKGARNG